MLKIVALTAFAVTSIHTMDLPDDWHLIDADSSDTQMPQPKRRISIAELKKVLRDKEQEAINLINDLSKEHQNNLRQTNAIKVLEHQCNSLLAEKDILLHDLETRSQEIQRLATIINMQKTLIAQKSTPSKKRGLFSGCLPFLHNNHSEQDDVYLEPVTKNRLD
jgi:hypothetical protein